MEEIKINDKVIELPIDSIVPHDGSHKTDETAVQAIMQSIKDFGITQPISVDKNNVIVTGNGVYKAAKALGMDKVPCIRVDYLTDERLNSIESLMTRRPSLLLGTRRSFARSSPISVILTAFSLLSMRALPVCLDSTLSQRNRSLRPHLQRLKLTIRLRRS